MKTASRMNITLSESLTINLNLDLCVLSVQAHDERPEDGQFRVTRSHENLVNRMSMLMLDTRPPDTDHLKSPSTARRKIASQLAVPLPSEPLKPRSGNHESSEDSDKEEHVVKIDSPSALFHSSHADHPS